MKYFAVYAIKIRKLPWVNVWTNGHKIATAYDNILKQEKTKYRNFDTMAFNLTFYEKISWVQNLLIIWNFW